VGSESEHDRRMIAIGLLFVRMLCDYFKPRQQLEAEILVLRHQLSVLQQRVPRRPLHLRWVDRALFIWLYRRSPRILDAITIIRPETILRLASKGFCRLLAMEVSFTPGPAADRQRGARPDPKNEP
jgi:hypothetical protein